jgi:hypothetical protein
VDYLHVAFGNLLTDLYFDFSQPLAYNYLPCDDNCVDYNRWYSVFSWPLDILLLVPQECKRHHQQDQRPVDRLKDAWDLKVDSDYCDYHHLYHFPSDGNAKAQKWNLLVWWLIDYSFCAVGFGHRVRAFRSNFQDQRCYQLAPTPESESDNDAGTSNFV